MDNMDVGLTQAVVNGCSFCCSSEAHCCYWGCRFLLSKLWTFCIKYLLLKLPVLSVPLQLWIWFMAICPLFKRCPNNCSAFCPSLYLCCAVNPCPYPYFSPVMFALNYFKIMLPWFLFLPPKQDCCCSSLNVKRVFKMLPDSGSGYCVV
jgi:hypothetical protein